MFKPITLNPAMKIVSGALIDLPSPANISAIWNFGSLLGLCLMLQILTGLFLSIHYCVDILLVFRRVRHIGQDVRYGWLLRILHANGARLKKEASYHFDYWPVVKMC